MPDFFMKFGRLLFTPKCRTPFRTRRTKDLEHSLREISYFQALQLDVIIGSNQQVNLLGFYDPSKLNKIDHEYFVHLIDKAL